MVAVLILTDSIHWAHLLGVSVAQGAMFAVQMPARQAAIPKLVGKERVGNAVALNAMAMSLMNVAAPGIGGLIYGIGSPAAAYITVTALMVVGVAVTSMIPKMYPDKAIEKKSVIADIKGGFSYARQNQIVRIMLIYSVIQALLSMPFRTMVPVFAKDLYGASASGVGLLATMAGLGGVAAAILAANLRKGQSRGMILLGAGVVSGITIFLVPTVPIYVVGAMMMIGAGFGETTRWGLGQALIMEETDDAYRARMMSLMMMSFGLMPAAVLPLGFAIEEWGARTALFGMSLMLLVVSVLFLIGSPKLRRLQ